ncbi:MAG TPA: ATP-dependent DNA ligase [Terriglobia bacterium]|jgi:DNA ligase-1|nr:ATP-dependent DNA ligase [Terriglobia bacterium]
MLRFAQTCESIAATSKKLQKTRLVADYLLSLDPEDAARAALFFTGRAFPRFAEDVTQVGGSLIWQALAAVSGASAGEMEAAYRRYGDLGGAAGELLTGKTAGRTLTLAEAEDALRELAARRGPGQKLELLTRVLGRVTPLEAKYFVKILTGELRIGLVDGLVEEALARAFDRPLAEIQRANMLTGDIGEALRLAAAGRLAEARLHLFHPVGFMLANAAETPEDLANALPQGGVAEDKYDGIRAQVHKGSAGVKLFSRTLDEIVEFPELVASLRALPGEFVLDGEIVGWRNGRPIAFTEFQSRLGRKHAELFLPLELPASLIAFDLLWQDGELLLDESWTVRRARLKALLGPVSQASSGPALQLSAPSPASSPADWESAFQAALERGHEGIMAKAPDSPYVPGRRGRHWLKLKRPLATLDVVVTAVEYGHGRRHNVLSDYTFSVRDGDRLVTIGKAYSGLTDAQIRDMTAYFLEHTLEDQGFRLSVEPAVVLEVAFNNIQRSNRHESGFALRFPRIARLRPDKPVTEIDTLERVRELYDRQPGRPGSPGRHGPA